MKFFSFLKILLSILAVVWLVFIGVFLFVDNRERVFNERLKDALEKAALEKKKKETEEAAKNKVFDPKLLKWNLVSSEAVFAKRDAHTLNVFSAPGGSAMGGKDKLWIFGGVGEESPNYTENYSDIWYSENGKDWLNIDEKNIWPGRHGHCLLAFNDYLFIVGGWSGYAHGYNDVWYSKDGTAWSELYKDGSAPWIGREDLACVNFNNKIFMLGGMETSGERTNDIWQLGE